ITTEDHPLYGQFLRQADMENSEDDRDESPILVMDAETDKLEVESKVKNGILDLEEEVTLKDDTKVTVKTGFALLKESARKHTLDEYSDFCGVPAKTIVGLAKKFTSHGRKAAIITHGGMMSGNGFYNAWAILTLNVLIG